MLIIICIQLLYSAWASFVSLKKGLASISLGLGLASLLLGVVPLFVLFVDGRIPSYDLPVGDLTAASVDPRTILSISFFNFLYSTISIVSSKRGWFLFPKDYRFPYERLVNVSYVSLLINILLVFSSLRVGADLNSHWTTVRGEYNIFYSVIDLATKITVSLPVVIQLYRVCRSSDCAPRLMSLHGCFIPPVLIVLSTGNRFFLLLPVLLLVVLLAKLAKRSLAFTLSIALVGGYPLLLLSHSFSIIRAKMFFAKSFSDLIDIIVEAIAYRLENMESFFDLIHPALESSTIIVIDSLLKDYSGYSETYLFSFVYRPLGVLLPGLKPDIVSPGKISAVHIGLHDVFLNPTLPGELVLNGFPEGLLILLLFEFAVMRASRLLRGPTRYVFRLSLVPIAFFAYRFDFSYLVYSSALFFASLFMLEATILAKRTWRH